jgi:transposase-like protein
MMTHKPDNLKPQFATWLIIGGIQHKHTRAKKRWVCHVCRREINAKDHYYGARSKTSYCLECSVAKALTI